MQFRIGPTSSAACARGNRQFKIPKFKIARGGCLGDILGLI